LKLTPILEAAMIKDRYELPLSTSSQAAADAFIEGVDLMLSNNPDPVASFRIAIDSDEGFAMAHVGLGMQLQLRMDGPGAKVELDRARDLMPGTSEREQSFINAVALPGFVGRGGPMEALPLLEQHLNRFPRDYLAANRYTQTLFFSGQPEARERARAALERIEPRLADDWAFLGGYSFILEEHAEYAGAQRLSERSLELYPRNAGAAHVISHVNYESNRHAGGSDWLQTWLADYDRRAGLHCHLSWHLALFELSQGHYQRAIQIYDEDIAPANASPVKLTDMSSFLWRLQLYGCAAGELDWEAMTSLAEPAAASPAATFFAAHAALWAAARRDDATLSAMADKLRDLGDKGHPVATSIVLPLVQGLAAFAHDDYDEAIRQIEPIAGEIVRVGGSHAQREVFEDTLLGAYLRGGRFDKAEAMLRERLARRGSARDLLRMAEIQQATERPSEMVVSLDQARQLWPTADPVNPEQDRLRAMQAAVAS
jgi:tetratricopeptide (TPR) repeat protein